MEVSGQLHASAALPPGKATGTHWIGGWVGPRAGLDAVVGLNKSYKHRKEHSTVADHIISVTLHSHKLFYAPTPLTHIHTPTRKHARARAHTHTSGLWQQKLQC
jgi:hypothetical protein